MKKRDRLGGIGRMPALLGALALLGSWTDAQSAWTQPEGATFLQLSLQRIGPYDELFRDHGPEFVPGREITESGLELYGEHGFGDGLTLIGVLPVRFLDAGSVDTGATVQPTTIASGSETSLGNVLVGVRAALAQGDTAVAAQLGIELPTGTLDRRTGLSSGLDAFTFLPAISVGRGFGKAYAQGYLGVGLRTDDYSHDWRVGVESGYRIDGLLLAGNVDVVSSFDNGGVRQSARNLETGLYLDEQEYLAYGFKWLYEVFSGFGLQGAVRLASSGNYVAKSPYLSLGLYLSR